MENTMKMYVTADEAVLKYHEDMLTKSFVVLIMN